MDGPEGLPPRTGHPNYIALQDNRVPQQLDRAASAIHRLFRCRRPLWHYLRYIRRVQTALGLPQDLLFSPKRPG